MVKLLIKVLPIEINKMIKNKKDFKAENIKDLEAQKIDIDESTEITDDLNGNKEELLKSRLQSFENTLGVFSDKVLLMRIL
ncbi:hypothetical protein A0H76_2281 [Hepatospora eriocheir]|uniref:Uncharacterized protein n=1 Tax=Hepatospora eriocheir TaxID=1081669 RepID=A0A1X0QJZ0_9MICR|nr:hypothetical protein A0H76_2281 [Hepatospora eriocheir]